jgi:hypothetical protein
MRYQIPRARQCLLVLALCCGFIPLANAATVWANFSKNLEVGEGFVARSVAASSVRSDIQEEPLLVQNGVVLVKGTIKRSVGSVWGMLGVDIGPLKEETSTQLADMGVMRVQMASKQALSLRIRLKGADLAVLQAGCFPEVYVQTTAVMKDLQIPLEAFEPPRYCGSKGVSSGEVMKNLIGVEITRTEPHEEPIEFTVGRIEFESAFASSDAAGAPDREWRLVWADEFSGAAGSLADPSRWQYVVGDKANFGSEQQYYRNTARDGAHDGKGVMQLWPLKNDDPKIVCGTSPCAYTAARLTLRPERAQFYGRIDARIKLPSGKGMNASLSVVGAPLAKLAWPDAGEFEVFRVNGDSFSTGFYHQGLDFGDIMNHDLKQVNDFHDISFEWSPERLVWKVDGVEVQAKARSKLAPEFGELLETQPFTLALGVSVDKDVAPDAPSSSPFMVDYVRVYQRSDLFDSDRAKYALWNRERLAATAGAARTSSAAEVNSAIRRIVRPPVASAPTSATTPAPSRAKLVCNRDNPLGLMLCY